MVLDTNIVLDWLVFGNRACAPLVNAIESRQVRWITTSAMRDELAHVLSRGVVSSWLPNEQQLWATWAAWAHIVEATTYSRTWLRCTDPDDQKFIDLGLAHAQWLISRDRAVLKLARRAAPMGLRVVTPERWLAPT